MFTEFSLCWRHIKALRSEDTQMRTRMILLAALAGVLLGGPSHAQTAVNCTTAAQAMAQTEQAGKRLELKAT